MNANELADEWRKDNPRWGWDNKELWDWGDKAATMLREQQAEIETLKSRIKELESQFHFTGDNFENWL
jgi:hypothetical protein